MPEPPPVTMQTFPLSRMDFRLVLHPAQDMPRDRDEVAVLVLDLDVESDWRFTGSTCRWCR